MSDTIYYIKSVTTCTECGGSGVVQHPRWQQFWEEHAATVEDIQQIHEPRAANEAWDKLMDQVFPDWKQVPEETYCVECEGEGKITRWVNLDDVLNDSSIQAKLLADVIKSAAEARG